jgi:hypothetical protein
MQLNIATATADTTPTLVGFIRLSAPFCLPFIRFLCDGFFSVPFGFRISETSVTWDASLKFTLL